MAMLPRVGERFGRYRIDSQIGRGGMGVVFGATDLSFDRTVALKVVSATLGDSAEFQQRFQREASVLARLDSPHVIAIYDYGVEDDCPYIATQYVGGGDLGGLIRARGAMPPRLALSICAQVADALHDAHRVGVVHRDVKPGNVLLRDADDPDPHAYLCDFGIARTTGDGLTAPGMVAGTWSYLSPECGRGEPGSPASDLYALGCLLWVMLTGSPPYTGSDIEVAVAHQQAPVPQLSGADEGIRRLNAVLARSMAKLPQDRYPDADRMRTALLDATVVTPSGVRPLPASMPGVARALSGASGTGGSRPISYGSLPPFSAAVPTRRPRVLLITAAACAGVLLVAGAVVGVVRLAGSGGAPTASGTPSTQAGPSDPRSDPPSDPGTTPTRLDQGGPITRDFDGDGLGDFRVVFDHSVRKPGGGPSDTRTLHDVTLFTSTGTAFTEGPTTDVPTRLAGGAYLFSDLFGDFDGDGTLDQVRVVATKRPADHYEVTGTLSGGAEVHSTWVAPPGASPFPVVGDVDGDGDDDVVFRLYSGYHRSPSRFLESISDGTGFGPLRGAATFDTSQADASYLVGDYDGDGSVDLAQLVDKGSTKDYQRRYELTIMRGGGRTFTPGPTRTFTGICCGPELLAADIDGDEDDEVVLVESDPSVPVLSVDLKDGRLTRPRRIGSLPGAQGRTGGSTTVSMAAETSDVNGDGLDDIVVVSQTGHDQAAIRVAVSDGQRLTAIKWASWTRPFQTSKYFEYFDTGGNPL